MDESSVDCLVLCHNKQDMKVSTKSVTSEYMCHIPVKNYSRYTFLIATATFISQTTIKKKKKKKNQTNRQIFYSCLII